jgi:hypothetical protein
MTLGHSRSKPRVAVGTGSGKLTPRTSTSAKTRPIAIAAKGTEPVTVMDEANARRLVDAWRGKDRNAPPIKTLPRGGFYAAHAHAAFELEFDPSQHALIARRSPMPPYDAHPTKPERDRVAALAAAKASKLGRATVEIVELHGKKKWYVVLRMDFVDPTLSANAFLSALDDLTKLMVVWRA